MDSIGRRLDTVWMDTATNNINLTAEPSRQASDGQASWLIIGETPAARRLCATLEESETAIHLVAPTDAELACAVTTAHAAAILVRGDVHALRYALALAHLAPTLPQVVTVFDSTMAGQLQAFLPHITVFSPASISAPSIAGPALGPDLLWTKRESEHVLEIGSLDGTIVTERSRVPARRLRSRVVTALRWDHRHHDTGTQMMVAGLVGLIGILIIDWIWLAMFEHHGVRRSFLDAARVVATVGPGPTHTTGMYAIWSGLAMLATIGFTAVFTAGLIDRLFEPRFLGLIGSRAVPRRDHVIVVGMGQLGIRVCETLLDLGVPVVGVERDRSAPHLSVARSLGIPVLVGDGTQRQVLKKLRLDRCRSLAAVGSDDSDNISVAVAVTAISPATRVVLRAGEHEAIAETRSLLPLGTIRDVTELAAAFVVSTLRGQKVDGVFGAESGIHIRLRSDKFQVVHVSRRDNCKHRAVTRCCTG